MSFATEVLADLRSLIAEDPSRKQTLIYQGKPIEVFSGAGERMDQLPKAGGGKRKAIDTHVTACAVDLPAGMEQGVPVALDGMPCNIQSITLDQTKTVARIHLSDLTH